MRPLAGKAERLLAACPRLQLSCSYTTRAPRAGEVEGREYFFLMEDEFLRRLVKALNRRYDHLVEKLREGGWYEGPVLVIDVSKIDFVSNVRHLIAVYEGIEALLVPKDFRE